MPMMPSPLRFPGPVPALLLLLLALVPVPASGTPGTPDERLFGQAVGALRAEDWPRLRSLAGRLRDPVLRDYLDWRDLRENGADLPLERLLAFLDRRPDWPGTAGLRREMERRLPLSTDGDRLIARFARRPPLTGRGRLLLARALLARGAEAEAAALIREGWPEAELDAAEEEVFRRSFGGRIDRRLDTARLDRLLWRGQRTAARRLLDRVDRDHRRLARARIALQEARPGVDSFLARVPARLLDDPGLVFDRLRWRERKGRRAGVREILLGPPPRLVEPGRWWRPRRAEIRRLLEDGDYRRAWALARGHRQRSGVAYAEAEWLAGWIALRFVGRPGEALTRFERLYAAVTTPVSRARAAYWAGRAAAALGRDRAAHLWFERAAAHPTTFYGQRAAEELGGRARLEIPPLAEPTDARRRRFEADSRVRVVRALCAVHAGGFARPFVTRLAGAVPDREGATLLLRLARDCERPELFVTAAKRLVRRGLVDRLYTYPLPRFRDAVEPGDGIADRALLLAMARQESHFELAARSPAGARGLLQFMPATARPIAAVAGLPFSFQRLLGDPGYQFELASSYLERLNSRFDGHPATVIAAYNAGPSRVRAWLARYGTPRPEDTHRLVDWVERLPFAETRNYVQRVLEGQFVYRELLALRVPPRDLRVPVAAGRMALPTPRRRPERSS